MVSLYTQVVYLLTKRESLASEQKTTELVRYLLPKEGDLGNLKMFLDLCNKAKTLLAKSIFLESEDILETVNYGTFKRDVKHSGALSKSGIFNISLKVPSIISSCSKNSVFFGPIAEEVQNDEGLLYNSVEPTFYTITQSARDNPARPPSFEQARV